MTSEDDPFDNLVMFDGWGDIESYHGPAQKEVRFVGGPSDGEVITLEEHREGKIKKIHLVPEPGADTSKPHRLVEADGGTYIIEGEVARYVEPEGEGDE